jgi:hypothetical protein
VSVVSGVPLRFNTKEDLLTALENRRAILTQYDKRRLWEHQIAEREHLKRFREKLREALKWDYATAKKEWWQVSRDSAPSCPPSLIAKLDKTILRLSVSEQQRFVMQDGGQWSEVYHLLTVDLDAAPAEVC